MLNEQCRLVAHLSRSALREDISARHTHDAAGLWGGVPIAAGIRDKRQTTRPILPTPRQGAGPALEPQPLYGAVVADGRVVGVIRTAPEDAAGRFAGRWTAWPAAQTPG